MNANLCSFVVASGGEIFRAVGFALRWEVELFVDYKE